MGRRPWCCRGELVADFRAWHTSTATGRSPLHCAPRSPAGRLKSGDKLPTEPQLVERSAEEVEEASGSGTGVDLGRRARKAQVWRAPGSEAYRPASASYWATMV